MIKQRYLHAFGTLFLLVLLAACARTSGSASGGTSSTTVQVTETDFTIDSSVTNFSPGVIYHFVVSNTGKIAHEFMILPKSEGSMSGMSMGKMDTMALASISNLNPGETKTLDYTFAPSAAGSHPELACYLPGHYEAGMKQTISVQS